MDVAAARIVLGAILAGAALGYFCQQALGRPRRWRIHRIVDGAIGTSIVGLVLSRQANP
jgi:outer membrane lipoprotein SlyB